MDVEKILHNSTDGDSTKNSTQDRPCVQVHHNQDITINMHNN